MSKTDLRSKSSTFDSSSIGSTGLKQSGGIVYEEFLPALRGDRGMRVFREMADNDPVCGAVLFAIKSLIRGVSFTVQAASDAPEAQDAKTFVEEVLDDMSVPFDVVIAEACSMFEYGFAPMETIWKFRGGSDTQDSTRRSKYSDGKIGLRTISLRAQTTITNWIIDPVDGSIDGLRQQPLDRQAVDIPIEKLLLFRTSEDRNNPEGRSILRNAYRPWFFKRRIEEIEAVGVERDLAGLPVARIPSRYMRSDASPEDRAVYEAYMQLVKRVKRDAQEGVIIPSDRDNNGNLIYDFSLLSAAGTRSFDTSKVIDRKSREIAMSVLADFIFLGQTGVGSFALSSNKTELFATAIGSFVKSICAVFNRHLFPRLWLLNGIDQEIMPMLQAGDLEAPDLERLGAFLDSLSRSGMTLFPDRELENHLRNAAGFPAAPEEGEDDMPTPELPAEGDPAAAGAHAD